MDRTIARLNTEEIINEVNNVITTGLEKLLGNHLYRYELLEKTHEAIMNLPNVRHHLNLAPLSQCEFKPEAKTDVMTEFDTKYGRMIEKMLNRIDELTLEVNQLKNSYKPEHVEVVKLEQKENIKLEIQEEEDEAAISEVANSVASLEEDEEADEEEEEEEETSVASSVASSDASSVASLEEADESLEELVASLDEAVANLEVASLEVASLENICSECDCKVILKEDIIIVDGKKYCGACDPSNASEDEVASEKDEEEVASEDEVTSEKDEEATEKDEVETEAEASEEEAEASEEEEYIEIDIDDVTYCTNNEDNGFIYELTEDGDVGNKVGYLKDGEPFFYADEK
jgi:hypothetical protein